MAGNRYTVRDLEELCRDRSFDVIVVGGGGSGATAAIEATERGCSVLVLEKMDTPGGSTQESGGSLRLVTDQEGTSAHYCALTQGATPKDVIDTFVDGLVKMPDWVRAHGGELVAYDPVEDSVFPARRPGTAFPDVPFADRLGPRARMRPSTPDRPRGAALWDFLDRNLTTLGATMVTGARVTELVEDPVTRAVLGVRVGSTTIRSGAVVLCCGGFNYDQELQRQYLGVALPALSPPGRNTGDGIRMAQQVGADLWHMGAAAATVGYKFPEFEAGFWCQMPDYGFVMVDQRAHRFFCETDIENHAAILTMLAQDPMSGAYLRVPSFVVFDDVTRRAGRLATLKTGENRHFPWSEDNSAEIERGWLHRADSLAELAATLGLPADELTSTVEDFNRCALAGMPDVTGRSPDRLRAIDVPPFYGAQVQPTLVNTQGGPRRDRHAAILRPDGSVIPGLFGAGELGSIWNRLYPGAGNVCECLVFGRIAGASAAVTVQSLREGVR